MSRFVLMAGGTGGHLFPAMALAEELGRRGHEIHLMTDARVADYGRAFPARAIHVVRAAAPSIRNPLIMLRAGAVIVAGIVEAWGKLRRIDADAAVGFGGYPTFPPFLAASLMGVPGVLHEANAVLGRANRALARFADALAVTFEDTRHAERYRVETVLTGNPVRDAVRTRATVPYPVPDAAGPLRLVVFGGSQGARAFSEIVPAAILDLPEDLRARLVVTQQCRPEDLDRVAEVYRTARVNVELAPFFADLPERIANAHLVVARAGASTVAELAVLGRPAILVPLPGSIDDDQRANAGLFAAAGAGWMLDQDTLSPRSLGTRLAELLGGDALPAAARAAATVGRPDAVERLADLAERVVKAA